MEANPARDNVLRTMTERRPVRGLAVHVSDASPRGFTGQVTAIHADALTVARDDNGAKVIVMLSRRQVAVVDR